MLFAGAWPSQPDDGNLINSSDLSWSREVFAVGDELGYIRLFRFPCSHPGVSELYCAAVRFIFTVQVKF